MRRKIRFTILCNEPERQQLAHLADRLGRSQGDTVRWAIRQLANKKEIEETANGRQGVGA